MKTHDLSNLSRESARTLFAKLHLHAANLRGLVSSRGGGYVAPPTYSGTGNLSIDLPILEAHCGELEAMLGDKAPTFQFAPNATVRGGKFATLTEYVLAAKADGISLDDADKPKRKSNENEDDEEKREDKPKDEQRNDDDEDPDSEREKEADKARKRGGGPQKKATMTQEILQARGVKTLDELNALPPRDLD